MSWARKASIPKRHCFSSKDPAKPEVIYWTCSLEGSNSWLERWNLESKNTSVLGRCSKLHTYVCVTRTWGSYTGSRAFPDLSFMASDKSKHWPMPADFPSHPLGYLVSFIHPSDLVLSLLHSCSIYMVVPAAKIIIIRCTTFYRLTKLECDPQFHPPGASKESKRLFLPNENHTVWQRAVRGARALTAFGLSLKGSCEKRSDKYHLIQLLISAFNFIPISLLASLPLLWDFF